VNRGKRTGSSKAWDIIHDMLSREMGVFYLSDDEHADSEAACKQLLMSASTDEALDIIELSFRSLEHIGQLLPWDERLHITLGASDAIDELNHRFKEHGVGYQFVEGEIVRIDSQYLHAEIVKPAVSLLNTAGFRGASEEFLKAHEHYRQGRLGEAMSEVLKAFESTMKAVCDENEWRYPSGAAAKRLIKVVLDNGLMPNYMETHLAGLRNTLEAGLPTLRNKNSGHGQRRRAKNIPEYFAGYALHLAATNIVFLVQAHEALNRK
jgi:Domain of unknown function (DUF7014)/AbiJ N-terminal domain 4